MNCLNRFRHNTDKRQRRCDIFPHPFAVRKAIPAILLASTIFLGACDLPWATESSAASSASYSIQVTDKNLDRQSLTRELVSCVTDNDKIEYVYNLIPTGQLDGMSFSTFDAYIRALSRMIPSDFEVISFRFLSDSERTDKIDSIRTYAGEFDTLLQDTYPVELIYKDEMDTDQPIYLYIQEDAGGTPYLSSQWVSGCMQIYDVAALYFQALQEQKTQAVEELLRDGQVPEDGLLSSQVIDYKTKELTEYYRIKVQSDYADYRILVFNLGQFIFLQPEVLDANSQEYQTRSVRFVRSVTGGVSIRDSVNKDLESQCLYLYHLGKKTIKIGDRADSKQFGELFGDPIMIARLPAADTTLNPTADKEISIYYSSATVTVLGSLYDDDTWDGRIVRIRLRTTDQDYSLGTSILAGMTRDDLLMLYPFADQTDYVLETTIDEQRYEMTFTFADDAARTITGVKLEMTG